MTMANFLIIGTAKAGTTSLDKYLNQHPEVYMSSQKEPRFFVYDGESLDSQHPIHDRTITDLKTYQALFDGVSGEKAIGETSPAYLVEPRAPERIKHYIPEAKIIAVLRNPAERAFSHFLHLIKYGYEPCHDFRLALQNEGELRMGTWRPRRDYLLFGFYYNNLKRYFEHFDRSQIKVFLFEDLKTNSVALLHNIFRFLEVDDSYIPNMSIHHSVTGIPKSRILHNFLSKSNPIRSFISPFLSLFISQDIKNLINYRLKVTNLQKPELKEDVRKYLINIYRNDILNTQELIQRDLSAWLE